MSESVHLCPVCGFDLGFEAWPHDLPSDEICACCATQFGYDDIGDGTAAGRAARQARLRDRWVESGMPWRGMPADRPVGWDPRRQLARVLGRNG